MRQLSAADQYSAEKLFSRSIYHNQHLGVLDIWQLPDHGGAVYLDETGTHDTLIALQQAGNGICWLHSFLCTHKPTGYPLAAKLREILPKQGTSIYSISSHAWYTYLLLENGFRNIDEVVEYETNHVRIPDIRGEIHTEPFPAEKIEIVYTACEKAFPPLWRQSLGEFSEFFRNVNYRTYVSDHESACGYLLADITEDHCHISRIAVAPDQHKKGIASALLRELLCKCQDSGIREFSVNTNKLNLPAVSFYLGLNFKQTGQTFPVCYKYI